MTSEVEGLIGANYGGGPGDKIGGTNVAELRESILESSSLVNWKVYAERKIITQQECGMLSDLLDEENKAKNNMLYERGDKYAILFEKLLKDNIMEEHQEVLLAVLDSLLTKDAPSLAKHFTESKTCNIFDVLMKVVRRNEGSLSSENVYILSLRVCASLLGTVGAFGAKSASAEVATSTMKELLKNLIPKLKQGDDPEITLGAIREILKSQLSHGMFSAMGGLESICGILEDESDQPDTQMQYLAAFCVWLLSLNGAALKVFAEPNCGVLAALVHIVKTVQREKVIRISFAALVNMVSLSSLKEMMVGIGLLGVLKSVGSYSDPEFKDNINKINDELTEHLKKLSTFGKYEAELKAGKLQKSAVHSSTFWRNNFQKFEKNQFALIHELAKLLVTKVNDMVTLAMACYDLGEFIRFHPDGRYLVKETLEKKYGTKGTLMNLMQHDDAEVQRQALLCVQKLLVQNWESLNKGF